MNERGRITNHFVHIPGPLPAPLLRSGAISCVYLRDLELLTGNAAEGCCLAGREHASLIERREPVSLCSSSSSSSGGMRRDATTSSGIFSDRAPMAHPPFHNNRLHYYLGFGCRGTSAKTCMERLWPGVTCPHARASGAVGWAVRICTPHETIKYPKLRQGFIDCSPRTRGQGGLHGHKSGPVTPARNTRAES